MAKRVATGWLGDPSLAGASLDDRIHASGAYTARESQDRCNTLGLRRPTASPTLGQPEGTSDPRRSAGRHGLIPAPDHTGVTVSSPQDAGPGGFDWAGSIV